MCSFIGLSFQPRWIDRNKWNCLRRLQSHLSRVISDDHGANSESSDQQYDHKVPDISNSLWKNSLCPTQQDRKAKNLSEKRAGKKCV